MVFSSITFLFYFLPLVLLFYFIFHKKGRNVVLLIASLFFYFYGEPKYIIVLILSCALNYWFGKRIEKDRKHAKSYLIVNLILNFGMLFYFKYFNFVIQNINGLFHTDFSILSIVMPIGISFFTFQATSYTIDIYRQKVSSAKNLWTFATYLALFPQLIAGPIVRYETVSEELEHRQETKQEVAQGIQRFIIGLSKKVLIANVIGELIAILTDLNTTTVLATWVTAIAITLQLYFDFSGYSDMAIGLGLMFGFHFLENFNYPLIAKSITDFWHRWHISLSSWFKDYVYIPLGGNRKGKLRQYWNILIVWLLTGLWHGANWNFIFWGLYFAVFIILEKAFLKDHLTNHPIFAHTYTFLLIIVSFVIFHFEDLNTLGQFLKNMFGFGHVAFSNVETIYYLRSYGIVLILAIVAMTPIKKVIEQLTKKARWKKRIDRIEPFYYIILFLMCIAFLVDESFNPFLYFRF